MKSFLNVSNNHSGFITRLLQGGGLLYDLSKRAMLTGNYSELDEAIRSKIRPYLYNNGDGQWIHCAHLACLRNRPEQTSSMRTLCSLL